MKSKITKKEITLTIQRLIHTSRTRNTFEALIASLYYLSYHKERCTNLKDKVNYIYNVLCDYILWADGSKITKEEINSNFSFNEMDLILIHNTDDFYINL